jgi:hypothetical protein
MAATLVTEHRRAVRCALAAAVSVVVLSVAVLGLGAAPARAGSWTLVSCTQPNGDPAPSDGWRPGMWAGIAEPGSGALNTCADGGSLTVVSSAESATAAYTGPEWVFTAPHGATIVGGAIEASLTAGQGQSWIGTPLPAYDGSDVIAACQLNVPCGTDGTASGVYAIDHPGGNRIYAPAICVEASAPACPAAGTAVNAEVSIKAADIELVDGGRPAGTNFSGPLLSSRARGVAALSFTATDFNVAGGSGPGIYRVTVQIDKRTAYSGVPDIKDGDCVALGTDPTTGGLIFDHAQPCAATASIRIPINTRPLSDGRHALTITVSDAAGNSRTVHTQTVRTFNPRTSPRPARGQVPTRLTLGWMFQGAHTTLTSASAARLPTHGHVAVRCVGRRCPRLGLHAVSTASISRLWQELKAVRLHSRDRLLVTITARHHRPEQIRYTIRRGRRPSQKLLH